MPCEDCAQIWHIIKPEQKPGWRTEHRETDRHADTSCMMRNDRVNNSGWSKSTTCSQRLSGRCTEKQTKKQRKTVCYLQHTVSPSSSEDFSRDLCAATSGASSAAAFTSAFASSAGAAGSATGLHQTQSFMQNGIAYVSSHECKSGGVK